MLRKATQSKVERSGREREALNPLSSDSMERSAQKKRNEKKKRREEKGGDEKRREKKRKRREEKRRKGKLLFGFFNMES